MDSIVTKVNGDRATFVVVPQFYSAPWMSVASFIPIVGLAVAQAMRKHLAHLIDLIQLGDKLRTH